MCFATFQRIKYRQLFHMLPSVANFYGIVGVFILSALCVKLRYKNLTQGWVKSSLSEIYYDDKAEQWTYRSDGRPSSVIHPFIDRLVAAIQARGIDYYVRRLEDLPTCPPAEAAKCPSDEDAKMET